MGDKGDDCWSKLGGGTRIELQKNAHMQAFFGSRCPRKKAPRKGAMVPVVGLEPTRMISPTDFESVTSANSITPANLLRFSAFSAFWKSEATVAAKSLIFRFSVFKKSLNLGISGVLNGKRRKIF